MLYLLLLSPFLKSLFKTLISYITEEIFDEYLRSNNQSLCEAVRTSLRKTV